MLSISPLSVPMVRQLPLLASIRRLVYGMWQLDERFIASITRPIGLDSSPIAQMESYWPPRQQTATRVFGIWRQISNYIASKVMLKAFLPLLLAQMDKCSSL